MENRMLRNEEDMVALAEELASRVPVAAKCRGSLRLPPWAGYGLSALAGAGAVGLWLLL